MKKSVTKMVAMILVFVLMISIMGCNSKDKKETEKTQTKKEEVVEGFYVDEESGEIVDAATGKTVTDGSVKVDEKTGDIVDTKTGETLQTKKETEKVKEEVKTNSDNKTSNKNTQSDSNNKKPPTNQNNTNQNNVTNNNQGNLNNGSSNNTTNNNTNNNQTISSKTPSSSKKVSLSRDRLYNKMISIYTKPTLNLKPKMSRYDFSHQINGTIPSQIQYIFDWYFGIMDGGAETELSVSLTDRELFVETARNVLNIGVSFRYMPDGNDKGIISTTADRVNGQVDVDYTTYSNMIDTNNASIQFCYDAEIQTYNSYVADVNLACDLVVNAVGNANVSGKDEVTAIKNIVNYICNNCEYWDWAATQQDSLGGSIKDCLQNKKAVCDGYAKTFYAMCYYAGIDVNYYNGTDDKGQSHAWNSVNINGTTYYFDVTWHDSITNTFPSDDTYIWSNKTEFSKEHVQKGTTIYFW